MKYRITIHVLAVALFAFATSNVRSAGEVRAADSSRLNILFIVSEDNGPEIGCYGTPIKTPVQGTGGNRGQGNRKGTGVRPVVGIKHNNVNETGTISNWQNPEHDAAGNMTTMPDPLDLTNGLDCYYDAWNRLAQGCVRSQALRAR